MKKSLVLCFKEQLHHELLSHTVRHANALTKYEYLTPERDTTHYVL